MSAVLLHHSQNGICIRSFFYEIYAKQEAFSDQKSLDRQTDRQLSAITLKALADEVNNIDYYITMARVMWWDKSNLEADGLKVRKWVNIRI